MERLNRHLEFVKEQLEFQSRQAKKFAAEPRRANLHTLAAGNFQALLDDLEILDKWLAEHPAAMEDKRSNPSALTLSWDEVEGLPPELLAELSISESDKTEFNIISILTDLGGKASLDRLLFALFKQSGEVTKRGALNQRLYRMVQKEMIYSVPGKKGVYSIDPIPEEEAAKLT